MEGGVGGGGWKGRGWREVWVSGWREVGGGGGGGRWWVGGGR